MWGRLSLALHSDKSEQSENEQYLQRVNKQNEYFRICTALPDYGTKRQLQVCGHPIRPHYGLCPSVRSFVRPSMSYWLLPRRRKDVENTKRERIFPRSEVTEKIKGQADGIGPALLSIRYVHRIDNWLYKTIDELVSATFVHSFVDFFKTLIFTVC